MSHRTVIILVAGAALSVSGVGCASHEPPATNPPAPEEEGSEGEGSAAAAEVVPEGLPAPNTIVPAVLPGTPIRTTNPPRPTLPQELPTWDAVASGHPAGATNPPVPLLAITADGESCFKEWYDPRAAPRDAMQAGGRILAEGEESSGTAIACPEDEVKALLGTP